MHDQRIEARPPLGGENAGHRLAIGGVGAQAIDRLGRKGDQSAMAQDMRGMGDGGVIRGRDLVGQDFHAGLLAG